MQINEIERQLKVVQRVQGAVAVRWRRCCGLVSTLGRDGYQRTGRENGARIQELFTSCVTWLTKRMPLGRNLPCLRPSTLMKLNILWYTPQLPPK